MVATVLTACGIETRKQLQARIIFLLQQCLPLAVLKLDCGYGYVEREIVATVLTACGIETSCWLGYRLQHQNVATVLTACGIETNVLKNIM